ncbi:MAG: MmgE/PrpD family protein [Proteobacteria bacterium]|nr:MmgE/PrpD family protein [Desulfobacula sp.]MBU3950997.1 MmgE/PrpD family protein [Pseudomonadota bacterium]MBU4129887.1 MmgE/PrpD family protein [Pseudomonadota bacterium]
MNNIEKPGYTEKLAQFCSGVRFEDLPKEVIHKAKLCILDYVANVHGSLKLEAVQNVIAYIRSLGVQGKASVHGCGFATDIHHAAFVNGTTAEAIEAQDGVRFGGNHPGVAVIPAALAIGQDTGLGGKQIIEAIVAGYEAANRVAAAMHPWHTLGGFLPTGTCGTFGAAAAAGRLYAFDGKTMTAAFGNAGFLLPVSTAENLMGGFTIKIVQGGQAASAGLMAAGLAKNKVTGAPYIIEGSELNGGFAKITTAADPTLERLTQNLGQPYSIMDVYFKPYTACRHTHGAAQAALAVRQENAFTPADIESVIVFSYGLAQLAVGKHLIAGDSFVAAQFSIPYVVAACLVDGELGPSQLTETRLKDNALIEFSKKVTVQTDETLNKAYPDKTSSRIEILFKNKSLITKQVDIPKGDPRDPMDARDITLKLKCFAKNMKEDMDDGKQERLITSILDLENLENINDLAKLI